MLIFGWIAGIISNVYNVPQIYHTYKTKSIKDLSFISISFRLCSYILYIIHAHIIKDPPLFWNTIISFIQVTIIFIQYFIYNRRNQENKDEKLEDNV